MPQEIELKFAFDPAAIEPLEQVLLVRPGAKGPQSRTMTSVYWDTASRDLLKAGVTLRVRETGGKYVQTVKSAAETLSSRGEWESGTAGPQVDFKALAATPLAPLIKDIKTRLEPVFFTRVTRTAHLVRQGKAKVEAALDRGEVEAGGRSLPICELELELKSGDPAGLYALARRLGRAAPLRLSFVTKAERGYRLADGHTLGEAVKQASIRLAPGVSSRQAFQAIAAGCLRQWTANAEILRAGRRPEALHQMRVALRRLRTALKLFEAVVTDDEHARLNGELAWLGGELDQGRDIDVLIEETFRPSAARLHGLVGLAGLGERLLKARSRAYDRMIGVLEQPRYLALVLDMAAWIETGAWAGPDHPSSNRADTPVETLAADGLRKLRKQIRKRGKALKSLDPESRHKLRIRAKRLRYALEFFGGLYNEGRDVDAMLGPLKSLQDRLGLLNDVTVAQSKGLALAEGGGRAAGDGETEGMQHAYAAGLMIGLRLRDSAGLLDQAKADWEAFVRAKPFWRRALR
jgi:inorganic triphosphatase YgiF